MADRMFLPDIKPKAKAPKMSINEITNPPPRGTAPLCSVREFGWSKMLLRVSMGTKQQP